MKLIVQTGLSNPRSVAFGLPLYKPWRIIEQNHKNDTIHTNSQHSTQSTDGGEREWERGGTEEEKVTGRVGAHDDEVNDLTCGFTLWIHRCKPQSKTTSQVVYFTVV